MRNTFKIKYCKPIVKSVINPHYKYLLLASVNQCTIAYKLDGVDYEATSFLGGCVQNIITKEIIIDRRITIN